MGHGGRGVKWRRKPALRQCRLTPQKPFARVADMTKRRRIDPKPQPTRLTLRIPPELAVQVKNRASIGRRALNTQIVMLIETGLTARAA